MNYNSFINKLYIRMNNVILEMTLMLEISFKKTPIIMPKYHSSSCEFTQNISQSHYN